MAIPGSDHSTRPLDAKFRIGIDEMDAQHAQWIHLIEEFRAAGSAQLGSKAANDAARRTLDHLLEYTRRHFGSEERFIEAHGYPDLDAHKARHRELVKEVEKLLAEIRGHKSDTTPLKLNLFITVWLMEHITQEDRKYAKFILAKPGGVSAGARSGGSRGADGSGADGSSGAGKDGFSSDWT